MRCVRAKRESDSQSVILKIVTQADSNAILEEHLKNESEFLQSIQQGITPAWLSYQVDSTLSYLVFEDQGFQTLEHYLTEQRMTLKGRLELALKISELIVELHKRRVIHRQLNPHHILVDRELNLKLIGFGQASLSFDQIQMVYQPIFLPELLPYISPEQTGRMNLGVSYRTDYYSLGVILYELFCGTPPFTSAESAEVIHAHIARQATAPHRQNPTLPPVLSAVIMHCLAKNANDRYRSAFGIREDLSRCLFYLTHNEPMVDFELGQADHPLTFEIADQLYGRDQELEQLSAAYESVKPGGVHITLIKGEGGIGKSSMTAVFAKSIWAQRGIFVSGKYEQFQSDVPYMGIVLAMRRLVEYVLAQPDDEIAAWKEKLAEALGLNGGVMTSLLPLLETLIGRQAESAQLNVQATQIRLEQTIKRFLQIFAHRDFPLVIMLDDLQWADNVSLQLIEKMSNQLGLEHLLLIGAYRGQESALSYPLGSLLDRLELIKDRLTLLELTALSVDSISTMLADSFLQPAIECLSLAAIVWDKTGGNPFFIHQYLRYLFELKLIRYSGEQARWEWDGDEIKKERITDNVADLLAKLMNQLSDETRRLLSIAALVGISTPLSLLSRIAGRSDDQMREALRTAIASGLVTMQEKSGIAAIAFAAENLEQGLEQLGDDFESHYELSFAFHLRLAEVSYVNGDLKKMQAHVDKMTLHAVTDIDIARAKTIALDAAVATDDIWGAEKKALELLRGLGIRFPKHPQNWHIALSLLWTQVLIRGRSPETLLLSPEMTDAKRIMIVKILISVGVVIYMTDRNLLALIILLMLRLNLQYGHSDAAPEAFAAYGMILCSQFGKVKLGYRYGQMAIKLLERPGTEVIKAKVVDIFGGNIQHYLEPMDNVLATIDHGYDVGLQTGDMQTAYFCASAAITYRFYAGFPLAQLLEQTKRLDVQLRELNQLMILQHHVALALAISRLIGGAIETPSQSEPTNLLTDNEHTWYSFHYENLIVCLFMGDYAEARTSADAAFPYIGTQMSSMSETGFYCYAPLAYLRACPDRSNAEQKQMLRRVKKWQKKLANWAKFEQGSMVNKWQLVEAERRRVLGDLEGAGKYYDLSIQTAVNKGFTHEAALANEWAGELALKQGRAKLAQLYLQAAYDLYGQWEATAKQERLQQAYSTLLKQSTHESTQGGNHMDLQSVMRAAQNLSAVLGLATLEQEFMKLAIENAGAERGVFLLMREDHCLIEAIVNTGADVVLTEQYQVLTSESPLPRSVVDTVIRSKEALVLHQATKSSNFSNDPFIQSEKTKSILCLPIMHQGILLGLLYLENNLVEGAFTEDRIELLSLLAAQAAISLENALDRQAIQAEKEKIEAIVGNIGEGILALDNIGHIVLMNLRLAHWLGKAEEEAGGAHWREHVRLIDAYSGQPVLTNHEFETALNERQSWFHGGAELVVEGKASLPCTLTLSPIVNDNAVRGMVLVIHDQTEEKKLSDAKNNFIRTAGHELRTPLTGLSGMLELQLEAPEKLSGELARDLTMGQKSVDRLKKVV